MRHRRSSNFVYAVSSPVTSWHTTPRPKTGKDAKQSNPHKFYSGNVNNVPLTGKSRCCDGAIKNVIPATDDRRPREFICYPACLLSPQVRSIIFLPTYVPFLPPQDCIPPGLLYHKLAISILCYRVPLFSLQYSLRLYACSACKYRVP